MIKPLRWLLWLVAGGVLALGASWLVFMPGKDIRGVWSTQGHGRHIAIGRTMIDVYEVTEVSCHRAQRIPAHRWLIAAAQDITLTRDGARLRIDAGGMLGPIMADRVSALPAHCPQTPAPPGNAQDNFDALWQAMAEHYPFFDLHGVDWPARRSALRPPAIANHDDDALFDLLQSTLAGLDDGAVSLRGPGGVMYSPAIRPEWFAERHMVRDNTLAQFADLKPVANTGLLYGWAAPGIGYVYMGHMGTSGGFNVKGADQARNGFAEIALAFAAADAVILDLRYAPGGSDDIALAYASYFTDAQQTAFTKSTRTQGGYTAPFAATLSPEGNYHVAQPTIILTSGFTSGAAEVFAMVMGQLSQVTVMGTPTASALSEVARFTLPNGWELGLPHARYRSAAGESYDGTGIIPDIAVPVDVQAARTGRDSTLAQAVAQLSAP